MESKAIKIIKDYVLKHLDKSDNIPDFQVYTVWKCKALQNWKFLLSTTLYDGMYYELTFNGDKNEWYLDAYKKVENCCIEEQTTEVLKENERLKDFIKKLASRAETISTGMGEFVPDHMFNGSPISDNCYVGIYFHPWREDDKKLLNELQKYIEDKKEDQSDNIIYKN